ncbi:MAG TPA: hypothetical protein VN670_01620 [Acidobacteriaceae bacterium]|nr:hypothetical protein [Acidobacteriaceae bacterium]
MSVKTVSLAFDIWAFFLFAASVVVLLGIEFKRRSRLSLEEFMLKPETPGNANSADSGGSGTFWTLQQYDDVGGNAWFALLEHDTAGVLRGWTGYRPELDALARILNVTPRELPPTTAQEFFMRTNISVLRPIVGKT